MGIAIGVTVIVLIMSPWGKQSGGHFNPAMTFAFFRMGKVARWDALFYVVAQFAGAITGVGMATLLLRGAPGTALFVMQLRPAYRGQGSRSWRNSRSHFS